jgi:SAM-dependent methyltransferase
MAHAVRTDAPGVKSGVEALSKPGFQLLSMIFGSSTEVPMGEASNVQAINDYWGRDRLGQAILDALATSGKNLKALTIDALAPLDQFHGGGKAATVRLARLAGLHSGMRVLDVGGGLGGPARTLAVEFGCHITVVDLTESYVRAAEVLTARLGLGDRVTHHLGNALELPFEDTTFDVVWTQNSGMNIAAKERLYVGFQRVLRPGGLLALQEPMAGPVQPPIFPVMWARDAAASFLRVPVEMRALIEAAGFRARAWDDVTIEIAGSGPDAVVPTHTIQSLVMGDTLAAISRAGRRNRDEGRIVMVQAVFDRP